MYVPVCFSHAFSQHPLSCFFKYSLSLSHTLSHTLCPALSHVLTRSLSHALSSLSSWGAGASGLGRDSVASGPHSGHQTPQVSTVPC